MSQPRSAGPLTDFGAEAGPGRTAPQGRRCESPVREPGSPSWVLPYGRALVEVRQGRRQGLESSQGEDCELKSGNVRLDLPTGSFYKERTTGHPGEQRLTCDNDKIWSVSYA